jgi:L-amino acid N-acyltransferase YncA
MQSGVTVRRAVDGDWPQVWPIWHEIVAAGDTYEYPPDTAEHEARRRWMTQPPETWVAEVDGRVVGTYRWKANRTGLGDHVANAGYMVAASQRGKGIGRLLAEHSLDRARSLGYTAMQFNTVVSTNHGAVALWRSLGFLIVGTAPDAFRHSTRGLVDVHVMHRYL